MLNKKEFLAEASKIVNEEIKGNLYIGYKVEIPGKMFNNSCFTIKNTDGLIREYDISPMYARYRLTETSVNNAIGGLKETILNDIKLLEEYKVFVKETKDKEDLSFNKDKTDDNAGELDIEFEDDKESELER